jgi:carboxypeptidase PM20D1
VQDNVLAAEARAVVNFRLLPGDTVHDVLVHVREVIDDDTVTAACLGDCREATPISDPDGEEFGVVETSIRQVFGDVVVAPNLVVGGTDARHYHRIAEAVYRFLPVAMGPDDRARVHGTDERISVEHFERAVRFYMTVMKNAAG